MNLQIFYPRLDGREPSRQSQTTVRGEALQRGLRASDMMMQFPAFASQGMDAHSHGFSDFEPNEAAPIHSDNLASVRCNRSASATAIGPRASAL